MIRGEAHDRASAVASFIEPGHCLGIMAKVCRLLLLLLPGGEKSPGIFEISLMGAASDKLRYIYAPMEFRRGEANGKGIVARRGVFAD